MRSASAIAPTRWPPHRAAMSIKSVPYGCALSPRRSTRASQSSSTARRSRASDHHTAGCQGNSVATSSAPNGRYWSRAAMCSCSCTITSRCSSLLFSSSHAGTTISGDASPITAGPSAGAMRAVPPGSVAIGHARRWRMTFPVTLRCRTRRITLVAAHMTSATPTNRPGTRAMAALMARAIPRVMADRTSSMDASTLGADCTAVPPDVATFRLVSETVASGATPRSAYAANATVPRSAAAHTQRVGRLAARSASSTHHAPTASRPPTSST